MWKNLLQKKMKMNKKYTFRLPEDLHRRAKLEAYRKGMTLQAWLCDIIIKALPNEKWKEKIIRAYAEGEEDLDA